MPPHLGKLGRVVDKVIKHLGESARPSEKGSRLTTPHLCPSGDVEPGVHVVKAVVLRGDQIGPVLPDDPQTAVQLHLGEAQIEVQHRVVDHGG